MAGKDRVTMDEAMDALRNVYGPEARPSKVLQRRLERDPEWRAAYVQRLRADRLLKAAALAARLHFQSFRELER